MGTINCEFTNAYPTISLIPTNPIDAPAAFVSVLVGEKGDPGEIEDIDTDELEGFTTDPIFYYILAST